MPHHDPASRRTAGAIVETLESRRLLADAVSSALAPAEFSSAAVLATANLIAPTRAYLIGNSMTDGVRYNGLTDLLARDGSSVVLGRQTGPGYSLAYNLNLKPGYWTSGVDPARSGNGDPWGNYQQAFASTWDVLTVQPAERRLLVDGDPLDASSTQNQGDVPMTMEFLRRFAVNSPNGQVFAYSRPVRRTDLNDQNQPNGQTFNYSAEWLKTYVDSGSGKNWNHISRSYTLQYMSLMRSAQQSDAATWNMKPVRLIPAAEAYYNVDQMIKAGKFAGTYVSSIADFYTDKSHPRGDTGSYLMALAFYASITGNDPRGVAPSASYLRDNPQAGDGKVQSLIQQAVYDAMVFSGYWGLTTPMPDSPPTSPPPPPPPPPPATSNQTPYYGSPFAVGASAVTIQAEDFDNGGQGVAFQDVESANLDGKYRSTGVDIQPTTDTGGGHNVGYVKKGEWLEYTINVASTGNYDFGFRLASHGSNGQFHFEIDGVNKSGTLTVPNTGGWQNWTTLNRTSVSLTAGQHVLRVAMDANGSAGSVGNFNWIRIAASDATPPLPPEPPPPSAAQSPFKGSPFAVGAGGATIQAEDFDNGGQGVAYHDLEPANLGGKYRSSGVDIQSTSDSGGGFNVGYAKAGEWLEYTINVASAGFHDFAFRVASATAGGAFSFSIDGVDKSGLLTIPGTGGWQNWTTITRSGVSLSAGQHVLRITMKAVGASGSVGNFNWLKISPAGSTPLASGAISGKLFSDNNRNGVFDAGDELLGGRVVFLDLDGDNLLDSAERRVASDAGGNFHFTGLVPGTYHVRRVFPGGYRSSTPALNITLSAGQNVTNTWIGAAKL